MESEAMYSDTESSLTDVTVEDFSDLEGWSEPCTPRIMEVLSGVGASDVERDPGLLEAHGSSPHTSNSDANKLEEGSGNDVMPWADTDHESVCESCGWDTTDDVAGYNTDYDSDCSVSELEDDYGEQGNDYDINPELFQFDINNNEEGAEGQYVPHFDEAGYDEAGYNNVGRDREGYDRWGYDREGYNREGYNSLGIDHQGYSRWLRGVNRHRVPRGSQRGSSVINRHS